MSKKLNTSFLENELNQSKFFQPAKKQAPPKKQSAKPKTTQKKKKASKVTLVVPERVERPERGTDKNRELKRFSHDLYVDQMEVLNTKLRGYFLTHGERKSNAQMVREAIDDYIEKHL